FSVAAREVSQQLGRNEHADAAADRPLRAQLFVCRRSEKRVGDAATQIGPIIVAKYADHPSPGADTAKLVVAATLSAAEPATTAGVPTVGCPNACRAPIIAERVLLTPQAVADTARNVAAGPVGDCNRLRSGT